MDNNQTNYALFDDCLILPLQSCILHQGRIRIRDSSFYTNMLSLMAASPVT